MVSLTKSPHGFFKGQILSQGRAPVSNAAALSSKEAAQQAVGPSSGCEAHIFARGAENTAEQRLKLGRNRARGAW